MQVNIIRFSELKKKEEKWRKGNNRQRGNYMLNATCTIYLQVINDRET